MRKPLHGSHHYALPGDTIEAIVAVILELERLARFTPPSGSSSGASKAINDLRAAERLVEFWTFPEVRDVVEEVGENAGYDTSPLDWDRLTEEVLVHPSFVTAVENSVGRLNLELTDVIDQVLAEQGGEETQED